MCWVLQVDRCVGFYRLTGGCVLQVDRCGGFYRLTGVVGSTG